MVVMEGRLSFKPILAHSCKRPDFDAGQPIVGCSCKRHVTKLRAETLVCSGQAVWKKTLTGEDDLQSILLYPPDKHAKIPIRRAATINEGHILRAIGASLGRAEQVSVDRAAYERRRIELYPEVF